MTVLLTRPEPDSRRIAAVLEERGIATLIWPLTRIAALADSYEVPARVEALLFTSSNGVRVFSRICATRDLPAFCVGDRTAALAREARFADVRSAAGDARALADLATGSGCERFLHVRGRDAAGDLAGQLSAAGLAVEEVVLYAAEPSGPADSEVCEALASGGIAVVTVWSRRNAEILAAHLAEHPAWRLDGAVLVAISENALDPLVNTGFGHNIVAERPDAGAMVAAICAALRQ